MSARVDSEEQEEFAEGGSAAGAASNPPIVGPELQALAKQVQTKYNSVILDAKHKLHDDRAGIKSENLKTLNIISKCGRFAETALKILQQSKNTPDETAAGELYTIFSAQIAYLQDEYGCLFVSSLGDANTAKLFRALRKNTSSLPPDAVQDLRCAAQVAASLPQQSSRGGRGYSNWGRPYRGDFRGRRGSRGPGRGYGRGRGTYQQQGYQPGGTPDLYDQIAGDSNQP